MRRQALSVLYSGFRLVPDFPAKLVLKGNLVMRKDIFPRQNTFDGVFLRNKSIVASSGKSAG